MQIPQDVQTAIGVFYFVSVALFCGTEKVGKSAHGHQPPPPSSMTPIMTLAITILPKGKILFKDHKSYF